MNAQQAVSRRIRELCEQRGYTIRALCRQTGISESTARNLLNRGGVVRLETVFRICDGLGITPYEFFDTPYFDGLGECKRE